MNLQTVLQRDRAAAIAGLTAVILLSWVWLLAGAGIGMQHGEGMAAMPGMPDAPVPWSPAHASLMLLMWLVMMVAMMLPAAAPFVLLAAAIDARGGNPRAAAVAGLVAAGYVAAWGAFAVVATLGQWGLERLALLSSTTLAVGLALAAGLLLAAGAYQFTPLKHACLTHCRSPVPFLTEHWRPGRAGAVRLGISHGAYCVGCCWPLMGLLFVGGIMNPLWIGGIALYVLLEKLAPFGQRLRHAAGAALLAAGVMLLFRAV